MNHSILFLLLFSIQAGDIALAQTVVLQDNLQGSTVGTQVGGGFTGEGYKPGTGENHILYDVPAQIQNGYVEVQVKGFNFNDFPPVNATNQSYETSFLIMYDGRGIPEPIVYFFDYRNNYFRWDVTYRSDKYDSPGVGNRWKGKIHIAEDSPERLNSTYAVYPVVPENTADWGAEPNGIYSYWDPNQWYTIRVEWDNNGKNFRFYRDGELVWDSKLDSGDPLTDNGVYTITSPYPWLPVDFKIHLGSGPDRYSSKMPNMVFRNFKVVSTGAIQNTAPVITSTAVTSGSVGQLYSYDVNASGNPAPTYSLTIFPSGMTINSTSGLIQWTPSSTGNFDVTVVASNGISPDAAQSFTINVQSSTTFAPIITSTAVTSGTVGQLYTYDVETDANPNPTYSLTTFPSGMTINSTTGLIQWTPLSAGNFDVTVVASNGINPDATQSFSVTVQESQSGSCPPSLVSYWKLDEISGNAYADFIGTNNATSTSVPTPLAGRVNGAQQFNGTSNGITAPGIAAYDFSTNTSFTFEAWIKHVTGSYTGEEMIVERKTSSGALAINLKFNSTAVSFSVRNTASEIYDVTSTSNLYDNNWHHVVGVRDASTNQLRIYVDGVLENTVSATYTAGFASPTTGISIGWRSSTSVDFFNGSIDEVAIYNRTLSSSEILQHYNNGLNGIGYEECQILTDITVLLQGPFISGAAIAPYMTSALNSSGFIPTSQPYNILPWNYTGIEEVSPVFFTNNPSIVDWILVELRDKNSPATTVSTRAGLLKNDGKIVDIDGVSNLSFNATPDEYYIVVKHRNHLGIMNSGSALAFSSSPSITAFDFTGGNVYGGSNAVADLGVGKFGMIAGDANVNGEVQNNDSEEFGSIQNGQSGYKSGDFNLNGQVQNNDNENYWKPNNGRGSQVPNI